MTTNAEQDKLQRADHDALVRVETKIDAFITSQADHETRLRLIESNTGGAKELISRVDKLETKNGLKSTLMWVGLASSAILNIIAVYVIFTKG